MLLTGPQYVTQEKDPYVLQSSFHPLPGLRYTNMPNNIRVNGSRIFSFRPDKRGYISHGPSYMLLGLERETTERAGQWRVAHWLIWRLHWSCWAYANEPFLIPTFFLLIPHSGRPSFLLLLLVNVDRLKDQRRRSIIIPISSYTPRKVERRRHESSELEFIGENDPVRKFEGIATSWKGRPPPRLSLCYINTQQRTSKGMHRERERERRCHPSRRRGTPVDSS